MWLTHFWHSWSQFFIFAWDVTAGGILRTGFLICLVGSDNGLSPGRRQAIIWTNAGILLIGPLRTNFSEILIEILTFSFKKMHLKMSFGKWPPSCLGLNVLSVNHCNVVCDSVYILSRELTYWGRDEMDNISQTTFPKAFSWMTLFKLR